MTKLSIVVPFYNVQSYIEACLQSVRAQLLEDYEVILVDDGSKDESLSVAEKFVAADDRFTLVRQENQGLGPARNTGTRNARGEYITFLDSDDLIAPRGYAAMVHSLDESGSAFAAGNAYRFTTDKGTYQSWTHRKPFAKTRIGTNLSEFPALIGDRMVWNKVYRRSFWDAGGFEFPAIKYEDYPVTLRAYLEAPAVDILHQHVYLWRDRESGDSITQQRSRVDNARDRFVSAKAVLDMLAAHDADPSVREAVHAYFQHIDVVALAEAMVAVPAEDQDEATQYALELSKMIDPDALEGTSRLSRLVHRSLLKGDVNLARLVAAWRINGDTKELVSGLRASGKPQQLPVALGAVLARRKPQNPLRPRKLKSTLQWADWVNGELHLTALTTLRKDFAHRATARAMVSTGDDSVEVTVDAVPADTGVQLHLRIDPRTLESLPQVSTATIVIELRMQALRWSGPITFRPDLLPGVRQSGDGSWWQLRGIGWNLGLQRLVRPIVIDRVELTEDGFRLIPGASTCERHLVVDRPYPTPEIGFDLSHEPIELSAAQLLADDPADNPVTRVAERPVVEFGPSAMFPLNWLQDEDRFDELSWSPVAPTSAYLVSTPVSQRVGDTVITAGRGWYGSFVFTQRPFDPSAPATTPVGTPPAGLLVSEDAPAEAAAQDNLAADQEAAESVPE